jgi:hypothetical protein
VQKRVAVVISAEERYEGASIGVRASLQELSRYLHWQLVGVVVGAGNRRGEMAAILRRQLTPLARWAGACSSSSPRTTESTPRVPRQSGARSPIGTIDLRCGGLILGLVDDEAKESGKPLVEFEPPEAVEAPCGVRSLLEQAGLA